MSVVRCAVVWLTFINFLILLSCLNKVSLASIRHMKSRERSSRFFQRNSPVEYQWSHNLMTEGETQLNPQIPEKIEENIIKNFLESSTRSSDESEEYASTEGRSEETDLDFAIVDKKHGEREGGKNLPEDIVTKFLRIVETQHLLGENCTAGTDLNLGEGVVDRYAQERFRVEADVAVNRANMLTRLWKYADPSVLSSEYLLHASVIGMVEFDENIFAAGNCYDEYQYKDYWLFCPYAFRLPDGPILAKNLAIEYKYMTNSSEWFFIARKSAERIIKSHDQFKKGECTGGCKKKMAKTRRYNAYTFNDTAHRAWVPDEILSVKYEDGKWSKPYYDCGGGNIWMLTYTVPFFGFKNNSYYFMGTSGIDIDLRRVDIDQCPLPPGNVALNIFAGSDKCKKDTTRCEPISGLGFRRGSYKCLCRKGFYHPDTKSDHKYYNGTIVEDEYEKFTMGEENQYGKKGMFECLPCAEGCESCVDKRPCIVTLNWVMRTIILVLSCIIILFLPAIVVFTWKYGNVKVVRAASPVLLRFITLGAFFIYCTPIVMYPTPNLGTCTLRVWLREIGFSLTYGALMLKTWRISVIFHVRSAKPIRITDLDLLKRLGMIVGVFCVFLIIRTLVSPPVVITGRTADDLKAYLCQTDWWDHSFTSLEVLFLIWGIRLCIVVRKAPSEFNESRFISMAIYNEFLLTIFLKVSMLFLQKPANPDLLYIIFFCHTQLTVTLLLCLIFGSKVYIVYRSQGKLEESSSTVSRPQTTTFLVKSKAAASQLNPAIQSSALGKRDFGQTTNSGEIHEEFRQLCQNLESLRERCTALGNKAIVDKITAMQEAAKGDYPKVIQEPEPSTASIETKDNLEKSEASVVISEAPETPEPEEDKVSTKEESPKSYCPSCGGKVKEVDSDAASHVCRKECSQCSKDDQGGQTDIDNSPGDLSPTNKARLRSGHARTHSIVINLDDSSSFTDEVTV